MAGQGYPQLPYISLQRRPAKGWWDNQERKNFGETVRRPQQGGVGEVAADGAARGALGSSTRRKTSSACGVPTCTQSLAQAH